MKLTKTVQNPKEIQRSWCLIDADGKILGRLATRIANLLRGKDKPSFDPSRDCGDYVVVINSNQIKFTGRKLEQKTYFRHSGYPGGLKTKTLDKLFETNSPEVLFLAVKGMIPSNRLKKGTLKRLKIYRDSKHKHEAQQLTEIQISN